MSGHRRYDAKTKARAVGIAVVEGVTETERQTGIPKTTIDYWLRQDPRFEQLRTRARDEVAEDFWAAVQTGLEAVTQGFSDPKAPLRDKAAALQVVYDRFALLTGTATSRSEHRDVTGELTDREREALADDVQAWLRNRAQRTAEERM